MNFDLLTAEQEAAQSLIDLIEQAKKCQRLYERAQMPAPEALKRLLGANGNGHKQTVANIPAPDRPTAPREAESDWVSIDVQSAFPNSIVLAILRNAGGPLTVRQVVAAVESIRPDTSAGTIANIGTKLDGDVITRSKDGWELIYPDAAPILHAGLIWGPPDTFNKYELAAHRRDAILHILSTVRGGLMTSQLIEFLQNSPWVHAPVNKELVQDDVELLSKDGKIRRRGASKKWELAPEKTDGGEDSAE